MATYFHIDGVEPSIENDDTETFVGSGNCFEMRHTTPPRVMTNMARKSYQRLHLGQFGKLSTIRGRGHRRLLQARHYFSFSRITREVPT